MRVLFLAVDYPYSDYPASGIYNEKCVQVLREHCQEVEVLVPRPLVPPLLSNLSHRWRSYSRMSTFEIRKGVPVHRPRYLQLPGVNPAFWLDPGAYLWCRRRARRMHERVGFDVILAFGRASGFAWRLGRHLRIPAVGWAIGALDVSAPATGSRGRSLTRALGRLDMVFYQSHQLRSCAASQLQVSEDALPDDRHVVLPHGIPAPPMLSTMETRKRVRKHWKIGLNQTVVLYVGRIIKGKGVFDLVEAVSMAARQRPDLTCVLVGSVPGFDDTSAVEEMLRHNSSAKEHIKVLPSCDPEQVWELLSAADIFAFPSHAEGMPNALLEAMSMGIPSVAYDIPPIVELDGGSGAVEMVPTRNVAKFAEALVRLSEQPGERAALGEKGKARANERFMVTKNVPDALRRMEELVQRMSAEDCSSYGASRSRS